MLSKDIPIVSPVGILYIIILHIASACESYHNPTVQIYKYVFSKLLQVLDKLTVGFRLPPPPGCPYEIYKLMIECWYVYN